MSYTLANTSGSARAVSVFGIETGKSSLCGPQHKSERDELLRTFHGDIPADRMCRLCRGSLGPQLYLPDAEDGPEECIFRKDQGPVFGGKWRLGFVDGFLAMVSRSRSSHPYGGPVPSLSFSSDWTLPPMAGPVEPKPFVKLDTEAIISGMNELLFHSVQRIWLPFVLNLHGHITLAGREFQEQRDVGTELNGFMTKHPLTTCAHMDGGDLLARDLCYLASRPLFYKQMGPHAPHRKDYVCGWCPTRSHLAAYFHPDHGLELVYDTWQNLGTCNTPRDDGWAFCWPAADGSINTNKVRYAGFLGGLADSAPFRLDASLASPRALPGNSFFAPPRGVLVPEASNNGFLIPPAASAAAHFSAAGVLYTWARAGHIRAPGPVQAYGAPAPFGMPVPCHVFPDPFLRPPTEYIGAALAAGNGPPWDVTRMLEGDLELPQAGGSFGVIDAAANGPAPALEGAQGPLAGPLGVADAAVDDPILSFTRLLDEDLEWL
ncbi:hypothetical protein B0T25DRAFT_634443 [Lasiosphaeria hispida]|uniref:Uncharacterized protein n=1 Tax=Lasiosphaeria hispida TaxID=260671 RepID=A0AAJ0HCT0_9PEZI|nr:hypothetical protein B0T25DRAFT_634443 [Lasiosphaeria hispida]